MTILEAATLYDGKNPYDWKNFSIDQRAIDSKFSIAKDYYSETLINTVRSMLIIDENSRPDIFEIG